MIFVKGLISFLVIGTQLSIQIFRAFRALLCHKLKVIECVAALNKALLPDKFSAALQICRRARHYASRTMEPI